MKLSFFLLLFTVPGWVCAQWVTSSPDVYNNTGNVGIGLSNPSFRLAVYSNENQTSLGGNTQAVIRIMNNFADAFGRRAELQFGISQSSSATLGVIAGEYSSYDGGVGGDLVFGTKQGNSGSILERLRINWAGNVGIGTSTPSSTAKLHVAGNLMIGNPLGSTSGTYSIGMPDGSGTINGGNGRNLVIAAGSSDNNASAIGGLLFLRPGIPTAPSNNYGNVLIADNGGKVGIGTGTPVLTSLLDVNGAIAVRGQSILDATATEIGIGDISSGDGYRNNIHFYTHDIKRMSIDGNGNVGIGTTSPDQKLTVKGIIHTEEVRVDMTVPGPDYVFEPTYNLTPLSEVETYIKANKHLPEVPSAKQMEEEGLNLKEMNLLLLKKVEELTLHLIEQQKQINELTSFKNDFERIKHAEDVKHD